MMKYTCVALFSCCVLFCAGFNKDCGKNEEYQCVRECPGQRTCNDRDIGISCLPEDNGCEYTCACKHGFIRNENNECVSEDQCDCGGNEVFQCVQPCPPEKSCDNRDIGISCTQEIRPCVFKCVCKPGLIRNDKNECVTEDQCENCTKENEVYDCGELCDNVCATLSERNRTHCDLWNHKCVRKCYCQDGFARDDMWNCVPIDDCPEPPKDENY